jgi:hypothetical protein
MRPSAPAQDDETVDEEIVLSFMALKPTVSMDLLCNSEARNLASKDGAPGREWRLAVAKGFAEAQANSFNFPLHLFICICVHSVDM